MMLHWVECRCARCWTSAANTLETPIATLPSPISENWSGWCLAVFPRYTVFFFLCRSDTTLSIFQHFIFILDICQKVCTSGVMCKLKDDYPFHQNTVGWFNYTTDNEAHADRTWFQDGWLSCIFHPRSLFFLSLFLLLSSSFSQLDGLLTDRESLPERSKEIRERLRGKGLPTGKMSCADTHIEHSATRAVFVWCVVKGMFLWCWKSYLFYAVIQISWLVMVHDKGVWFLLVFKNTYCFCYHMHCVFFIWVAQSQGTRSYVLSSVKIIMMRIVFYY